MDSLEAILSEYKMRIDNASTSRNSNFGKQKRVTELQNLTHEISVKIDAECRKLHDIGVPKEDLKEKAHSIMQQLINYAAN